MIRTLAIFAISLGLFCSVPASATVIYKLESLQSPFDVVGQFEIELPDYLTSQTSIPASALTSCSLAGGLLCDHAEFTPDLTAQGLADTADRIGFYASDGGPVPFGAIFDFANRALSAPGVYANINETGRTVGRLTVTDIMAVPETSVWAMLLLGMTAAGAMMRRSRGSTAVSAVTTVPRP